MRCYNAAMLTLAIVLDSVSVLLAIAGVACGAWFIAFRKPVAAQRVTAIACPVLLFLFCIRATDLDTPITERAAVVAIFFVVAAGLGLLLRKLFL